MVLRNPPIDGHGNSIVPGDTADDAHEAVRRLSRLVVAEVHRPAYNFQTVHWGWRCRACDAEAEGRAATVEHKRECPLAVLARMTFADGQPLDGN
jgi:hypothetical protein